jgi:mRNA interferase MazF
VTAVRSDAAIARRSVVLVPFPFSDLSAHKLRPALVMADAGRGDWLSSQITSRPYGDTTAVELTAGDFDSGGLQIVSHVRPLKLFTAHESLLRGVAGVLTAPAHGRVLAALVVALGVGASGA